MMKIGVIPDSFQVPFKEAVILARDLGVQGLQPFVTRGELAPENLTKEDRADIVKYVKENGLQFSAVCADFGLNFKDKAGNGEDIKRTMAMMDLARDFGTNIVTTHIGHVPEDEECEDYYNMVATIEELGKYGDKTGVVFATETGPEKALPLRRILEKADTKSARVNFDPANLVMCSAQNAAEGVYILHDYIAHTHAKDGIMIAKGEWQEKILGEGDVNYHAYLSALKDVGYDGFLTIEREAGATRMRDIAHAVRFLKEQLGFIYR